jgi:hypothetical protein
MPLGIDALSSPTAAHFARSRYDAAANDFLGARQMRDARSDQPARECLDQSQRGVAARESASDAFERAIILGE